MNHSTRQQRKVEFGTVKGESKEEFHFGKEKASSKRRTQSQGASFPVSKCQVQSNSNDSKHFFLHYFGNPRTQSYGYVKYRISNPSRKGRETDTQFKDLRQSIGGLKLFPLVATFCCWHCYIELVAVYICDHLKHLATMFAVVLAVVRELLPCLNTCCCLYLEAKTAVSPGQEHI
ncbi:hypothetical protein RND71_001962 [Anisodus tanguticus]|uniref:Uncharacterized protein n=1 Tax=Anisodus tanguticus TaxID=243964 RepID=A0AAE1T138_9SOLA|nr:hypothetical protein RND71_001962 [Anisodus tanguticus]